MLDNNWHFNIPHRSLVLLKFVDTRLTGVYALYTLTLHKTSNKNVLECVKCVCGHDFLARSVVHTT